MKEDRKMKFTKIFLVIAASVGIMSCNIGMLDTESTYQVGSSNVWGKASLARLAVNGIYNEFYERSSTTSNEDNWRVMFEAYSSVMDTDRNWYENQKVCYGDGTPSSGTFSSMFKYYYTFVFRSNDVISHIDQVPDMEPEEKARLKAEAKFLRAYGYFNLNVLWRGVPLYLEYIEDAGTANKPRSSEADVWQAIINDLTDCINEENLPDRYAAGDGNYGRVTKGAAYAYRGHAYQFMASRLNDIKYYELALSDFEQIEKLGYKLYTGAGANSFKELLKPANEQCEEMIFSIQCVEFSGMGNPRAMLFGNRGTYTGDKGAWNNYIPNPGFVESFENADGSKFNWEDHFEGWNSMTPKQRSVFFLRNNMTDAEKQTMLNYGADMTRYDNLYNEENIRKAYADRDPRLMMSVITPYSQYDGGISGNAYTFTLRWPYRSEGSSYRDLRTDTNSMYYYLWRKYVPEGLDHTMTWLYRQDNILCRYAEVLLRRAECLNELGRTDEAVTLVNMVRTRAGHVTLNNEAYPATAVKDQADMRERIRNEFYWELGGEDSMYFNELRWGIWVEKKFQKNTNGLKQVWGEPTYTWYSLGDYVETWPIPAKEREMNSSLTQNPGWID